MTGPQQWRLLAFFALIFITYIVISLLVFGALGLLVSTTGGITVLALFSSVIGMVVAMFYAGIIAAVHSQLRDDAGASLTETFD